MTSSTIVRLLEKQNPSYPASGSIKGGLVFGVLSPFLASVEFNHVSPATGKFSSAIVKLKIPKDGKFHRTEPILTDEFAKNNYLIEVQFLQGLQEGKKFRGELGEPTIIQDPNLGEIISIPCESIDRSSRESYGSPKDDFITPKQRFIKVLSEAYESARGSLGTILSFRGNNADTAILLPDESQLKRLWFAFGPTKIKKLLTDVIDVLEDAPQLGGKLKDFFYDGDPDETVTRKYNYYAEEFGLNSSGVIIDPITFGAVGEGAEGSKQINTDNISYKNHVIAKGDSRSGTTPPNLMRFRSYYLNGTNREVWLAGKPYAKGQGVKMQYPGQFPDERYFISKIDNNIGNVPAPTSGGSVNINWTEDFTIDPANTALFFSPNPWFSDLALARSNLVGKGNPVINPGGGGHLTYEGFFFDWNIERTIYDRDLATDPYELPSVKSVIKRANTPPAKSAIYDGYRIILGTYNVDDFSIGVGFEGMHYTVNGVNAFTNANRGRVLEYNGDPGGVQGLGAHSKDTDGNGWILSDAPIDQGSGATRIRDTVNDLETSKVLKWDRDARGASGDWIDSWDINLGVGVLHGYDLSSPFHIVKSTYLVDGATGIPNQAFEARFEYKSVGDSTRFEKIAGDYYNRNSRGVWLSWMTPLPYIPASPYNAGDACGKNHRYPYFDTWNLNRTCDGIEGWNAGLKTEELGTVNGVHFKLRIGWFTGENDTEVDKALGYANMPMVYWSMDKWGHVYFQDFTQPGNYEWETFDLSFGPRSPQNYFFSRFDELVNILGYTLPYDQFIPEREFSGVQFDWRYVKYQGIFSKYTYSENAGNYLGAFETGIKNITASSDQAGQKTLTWLAVGTIGLINYFVPGFFPTSPVTPNVTETVIDHTTIAIDEFCFITEMYANSDETEVADPRSDFIQFETERDYLTLRARARAHKARQQFFPQFWHMTSRGNVNMKVGERFIASGPQVPGGSKELVCAEVKHIDDQDGYTMQVLGVNKFEASEVS